MFGASGGAWVGEEEGVEAEPLSASARLGVAGGRGERRRWRRRRSGGKNRGGGERSGEREEGPGRPGVALASSRRDEGEPGRLGGRRWPGRVRARVGRTRVLLAEEEGDRGVVVAGWAASWSWARWAER